MNQPLPFLLCLSLWLASLARAQSSNICGMTPMSFPRDFLSSCESLEMSLGRNVDCDQAWTAFQGAFAGVPPENVTSRDYAPYFDVLPIMVMPNESLFWTRTSTLVSILSMMNAMGVRVVSSMSETVLSSRIINSITPGGTLNWCGNQAGIDFQSPCLCSVTGEFWTQFSKEFAQAAQENVFFLTDGQADGGAFRNNSFFSTVELPNLRDESVTRLITLIIHEEGKGDSCSGTSPSVQMLRNRILNRRFSFDCYDIVGDLSQTEVIAKCVQSVVDKVQEGTEDFKRQITCGACATTKVSLVVVLCILFLHLFDYQ